MKKLLTTCFLVLCCSPLFGGSISVGDMTTLDRLINGFDTVEYPELVLSDWKLFGNLGITPPMTTVKVLSDYKLEFGINSPGFELFGYTLNPAPGFKVEGILLEELSSNVTTLGSIGDVGAGNETIVTSFDRDVISGVNSIGFTGSYTNTIDVKPIISTPEGSLLCSVPVFLWGLLRKRA